MRMSKNPAKIAQREAIARDLKAFLDKGGEVQELPGFGVKRPIMTFATIRIEQRKKAKK